MRRARVLAAIACAVMAAGAAGAAPAAANHTAPCADVTLLFARGSGQGLDAREAPKFFEAVDDRLGAGIDVNRYELGTSEHGGAAYPAVGLDFANFVEAEASWTGPLGGEYRDSVQAGVTEFAAYMDARAERCPDEVFVVGGYSQGAQVVGTGLFELDRDVRDRIAFVALFGDPKLYLPEGRGPFPPACWGSDFSPWRRGSVSCWTDNGILEARKPYLPEDIEERTGSWCDRNDGVCNNNIGNLSPIKPDHNQYADDGAEIDEAAQEIAEALAARLPDHEDEIDVSIFIINIGTAGIDVAFLIDTTGSMFSAIDAAREIADEAGTSIVDLRGRIALTEYRDAFDAFTARIVMPLGTDIGAFRSGLAGLVPNGGGDTPEALLHALMTTFNGLDWTPGATKAAVVLTDAGYHDPDEVDGTTLADVVQRSLEIDPVNVYPVVPDWLAGEYTALAEQTSGKVIPDTGNTREALLEAVGEIRTRPTALLALGDYFAPPGQPIRFDASRSYDVDSTITRFEWDFDGNGTIDQTTTDGVATHTYAAPYSGLVEVRVFSADGGVSNAVANVTVRDEGFAELAAPGNLSAQRLDEGRATRLTWDAVPGAEGYVVRDATGETLALRGAATREIVVSGLPAERVTLQVAAIDARGTGAPATVEVGPDPSQLAARPAVLQISPLRVTLSPSAKLTSGGSPVAGKPVTFAAGGRSICTATTDGSGVARCTGALALVQSLAGYRARFAGDHEHVPAEATGAIVG